MLGHLAMSPANFDPAGILAARARSANGVTRNANRPRDLFAAFQVREKMLPKPLPSHV
jgi:hypothetical protein